MIVNPQSQRRIKPDGKTAKDLLQAHKSGSITLPDDILKAIESALAVPILNSRTKFDLNQLPLDMTTLIGASVLDHLFSDYMIAEDYYFKLLKADHKSSFDYAFLNRLKHAPPLFKLQIIERYIELPITDELNYLVFIGDTTKYQPLMLTHFCEKAHGKVIISELSTERYIAPDPTLLAVITCKLLSLALLGTKEQRSKYKIKIKGNTTTYKGIRLIDNGKVKPDTLVNAIETYMTSDDTKFKYANLVSGTETLLPIDEQGNWRPLFDAPSWKQLNPDYEPLISTEYMCLLVYLWEELEAPDHVLNFLDQSQDEYMFMQQHVIYMYNKKRE